VKEVEERGAAELERLLKRIPRIKLKSLKIGPMQKDPGSDVQVRMASVVTAKPAIRGHFKTGHRDWPET